MSAPSRGRRGLPTVALPADRRFRRADLVEERRRAPRLVRLAVRWGVAGLVLALALAWGVESVLASSLLRVQRITVSGNARLSTGEIVALVEGLRSENILQVDLATYRDRVMDAPWVEDVTLSRVLPSTIAIRIVERVPMAIARVDTQLYLIDRTGALIDEYGPEYKELDLPIADGVFSRSGTGITPNADSVRLIERLLQDLVAHPDVLRAVSQFDVSAPANARVMLGGDAVWLEVGDERFVERILRYLEVKSVLKERLQTVDAVDLRYGERLYLRAAQAASPSPGNPGPNAQ